MIIVTSNCVDKLPPQSITMGDSGGMISINLLCFGQLAEVLGRTQEINLAMEVTCRDLVNKLGIGEWTDSGLKIAVNGEVCSLDTALSDGDEVALLPPVSGG